MSSNDESFTLNENFQLRNVDSIAKTGINTVIDETAPDEVDLTGVNEIFSFTWDTVINLDIPLIKWKHD